jgi:trigger factor
MSEILTQDITINNIIDEDLEKKYQVIIQFATIDKKIDDYILKIKGNYSQSGFRKGYVPAKIIKDRYLQSIMAEESQKIINENIKKIIDENNLALAISPKIDIKKFEYGHDFEYEVTFEMMPKVPKIGFDKIKITKSQPNITQKDIEEETTKSLAILKKWSEKSDDKKSNKKDSLNINYVGKIDGKEFEGGKAENQDLEIGSKKFIDDFEDQLVGAKKNDQIKVKVKFPKEYHNKELSGKKAEFDVTINKISSSELPEITDELIKEKFNLDNLSQLQDQSKEKISKEYQNFSNFIFKLELSDYLNKKFDFSLPEGLINERFDKSWPEIEKKDFPNGFDSDKEKKKLKEKYRKNLEKDLRCSLIFSDIAKENNITIEENDIDDIISEKAKLFPGNEELFKNFYMQNEEMLQQVKSEIFEQKIIKFFEENIQTKYKSYSLKDIDKEYQSKVKLISKL